MVYQLAEGVNLHVLPTKQYKTIRIFYPFYCASATRSHHENVHFSAACWKQIV